MPRIHVEYSEKDILRLIHNDITLKFPDLAIELKDIDFLVKSRNNYKPQEWEPGKMLIKIDHDTD